MTQQIVEGGCYHLPHNSPEQDNPGGESETVQPKLKPLAYILILFFAIALAAGNYFMFHQAPLGNCGIGPAVALTGADLPGFFSGWQVRTECLNYVYYFVGAPLAVGLLLLLILPNLVVRREVEEETSAAPVPPEPKKAQPSAPPKPTTDAAVQMLALLQREGRLIDFLREDIQPYDDAQIGAAVRDIHQKCRDVLAEHITLERVLNEQEGDEVTVPEDFDPSAIRLTGNVGGEPPFRGALRHCGWQASKVKLPMQPAGQNPRIIAPAEVEIPEK